MWPVSQTVQVAAVSQGLRVSVTSHSSITSLKFDLMLRTHILATLALFSLGVLRKNPSLKQY